MTEPDRQPCRCEEGVVDEAASASQASTGCRLAVNAPATGLALAAVLAVVYIGASPRELQEAPTSAEPRALAYVDKFNRFWCGGHDPAQLNNFGSNVSEMAEGGWVFSKRGGHWSNKTAFRPSMAHVCDQYVPALQFTHEQPCSNPVSPNSYYGWDYPGDGVIRLPLGGHGELTLDIGNLYYKGQVTAAFDGLGVIGVVGPSTPSKIIKAQFFEGWMLTISEENPRGIIAINSISFECRSGSARSAIGNLRVHVGSPQYAGGVQWVVQDMQQNCNQYCVLSEEEAQAWGSDGAVSYREFCATTALFRNAQGFLYPDPGDGENTVCKVFGAKCKPDMQRVCDSDLSKYAAHMLIDRHPKHYPKLMVH